MSIGWGPKCKQRNVLQSVSRHRANSVMCQAHDIVQATTKLPKVHSQDHTQHTMCSPSSCRRLLKHRPHVQIIPVTVLLLDGCYKASSASGSSTQTCHFTWGSGAQKTKQLLHYLTICSFCLNKTAGPQALQLESLILLGLMMAGLHISLECTDRLGRLRLAHHHSSRTRL